MRPKLLRRAAALADVEESAVYIGLDNPVAAVRFMDAVEATMRLLLEHPELGPLRAIDRRDLAGLRSLPVQGFEKHLVFYRPTKEGIEVVRVLHGARDLGAILEDRPEE